MQYVSVSCFGNSGGSAVVDLLREYDCVQVDSKEYEHIFLADKDAVIDTYRALKEERGGASDVTIRRFMDEMYAIQYYRGGSGYFSNEQRRQIDYLTKAYVKNVVSLESISRDSILVERINVNSLARNSNIKSKIKKAFPWLKTILGVRKKQDIDRKKQAWDQYQKYGIIGKNKGWYMRKTDNEELKTYTAELIKGYLKIVTASAQKPYFVLDHFLEMDHLNTGNEILGANFIKTIVVIRDPRDQYISCISQGRDFVPFNIDVFCQYYRRCMHILNEQNPNFYHIVYFNDLIENYDATVKEIENYLNIDGKKHHTVDVGKKLDISISRKHNRRYLLNENRRLYKNQIEKIERELPGYLQQ